MQITTFEKLWQEKNPGGIARVGKGRKVEVTFRPDGKIYRYQGSILNVADRLELIPEIVIEDEVKQAMKALKSGKETTSFVEIEDTLVWTWGSRKGRIDSRNSTTDEFDRQIITFFITYEKSEWV